MITTEHAETAREFLAASDREFDDGDILQGAEKLWGAAAHAVMAVAQERGWPHESHRSLKNAVNRISAELDDPYIETCFGLAEKFHRHFYHDSMEEYERHIDRPHVKRFVDRMLTIQ